MKILLIFPNLRLRKNPFYFIHFHQPLGIAYIASVLREAGHEIMVIDALAENLVFKQIKKRIIRFDPEIIGISSNISNSYSACVLASEIRRDFRKIKVIFGGPWATVEYKFLLIKRLADFVVIGEGERTIEELCDKMDDREKLATVDGIAFRDGSEIIKTKNRALIEDLDSLPFPAWDLFPSYKKYPFIVRSRPYYPIMTTRGCPLSCIHCTKVVHGHKYRKRSVQNVIEEIRYLKKNFGLGTIFITDDTFTLDKKRAHEIFDEIIRNDFNINMIFANGVRADTLDEKMVAKMKAAGAFEVALGIESGNQRIVNLIGKKLDLKAVENAIHLLKKYKINTMGFLQLGHPWDDYSTMFQTYYFTKKLKIDHPFFFRTIAFPGTKLYDLVKEHGKFLHEDDRMNFETYNLGHASFEIWNLKTKDLNKAFKKIYALYFFNIPRFIQLFKAAKSYPEVKWLIRVALDFFYNYIDNFFKKIMKIR
ncbi:MAG: B12-binding domain-containing radical SAM protein [Promethearchaeota archaeon]